MKYKWGSLSKRRLEGVNPLLVECVTRALSKCKKYDQTVPWMGGLRTAEEQNHIFTKGNSRLDGHKKKSYHQSGNALDVVPFVKGKANYKLYKGFQEFAHCMFSAWQEMQTENKEARKWRLEWGGFWTSFNDKPHWQLKFSGDGKKNA